MNKDMVKGKARQLEGKVNEETGKASGNELLEFRGKAEHVAGKLQEKYFKGKTAFNDRGAYSSFWTGDVKQ
jgi:uncharacterized protein YjbJ (UPF0337 family)